MDSGFRRNDESCEPSTIDANHKVKPVRRLANAHKSVTGWKQELAYLREVPRTFRSAHVRCPERAPRGCTPRQHLYSHCAAGHQTPLRPIGTSSNSRLPAMGSCPYVSTNIRSIRSESSVGPGSGTSTQTFPSRWLSAMTNESSKSARAPSGPYCTGVPSTIDWCVLVRISLLPRRPSCLPGTPCRNSPTAGRARGPGTRIPTRARRRRSRTALVSSAAGRVHRQAGLRRGRRCARWSLRYPNGLPWSAWKTVAARARRGTSCPAGTGPTWTSQTTVVACSPP